MSCLSLFYLSLLVLVNKSIMCCFDAAKIRIKIETTKFIFSEGEKRRVEGVGEWAESRQSVNPP